MGESKLIIIKSDDWVTVYKDNVKVWDGHDLSQFGDQSITNIWKYCEENGIKRENVIEQWVHEEDQEFLELGALADTLNELNGKYV